MPLTALQTRPSQMANKAHTKDNKPASPSSVPITAARPKLVAALAAPERRQGGGLAIPGVVGCCVLDWTGGRGGSRCIAPLRRTAPECQSEVDYLVWGWGGGLCMAHVRTVPLLTYPTGTGGGE